MRYEVYSGRFDIAETLYSSFDVDTEEEAVERFKKITEKKENAWDSMRIIQVIVERKAKPIASINRKNNVVEILKG